MEINWYPGHMKKSFEEMEKALKLVDCVGIVLDCRIPKSSYNPKIEEILKDKPRIYLLNKKDLAEDSENEKWLEYFRKKGHPAFLIEGHGKIQQIIEKAAREELKEKFERNKERQIQSKNIRLMFVGIPNSGKSTIINNLAGRKGAQVGNRPGVTRANQWIKSGDLEFLDTPGVLWPKLEDESGLHLAFTEAIKDEILDTQDLGFFLIKKLLEMKPEALEERYDLSVEGLEAIEIMDTIGEKRGALLPGREIDYTRVGNLVLDDFRKGRLGKISLERVEDVSD